MTACAHFLRAAALAVAMACMAPLAAHAAPACVEPGGMGGTGAPLHSGGTGGTGGAARGSSESATPPALGGLGGTGAPIAQPGIGGTGAPLAQPGIGGTGAPLAQAPGGMGGTGDVANGGVGGSGAPASGEGTGIVGTITGFASICVNGLEVHFADDVPVTENGLDAHAGKLAIGQVVAVEAGPSARGLEARRIAILHAFEGPLSEPARGASPMRVMGQPVRLAPDARVAEDLQPGEPVRVSGLRNATGEVIATRVERAPGLADASAIGSVGTTGDLQGLALRGAALSAGNEVLVRGRWAGAALEVDRIDADPSIPFAGRVSEAVVEGLVHERQGGRVTLGNFAVTFAPGTRFEGGGADDLGNGRRVRVSGRFTGSREVSAARIEFVRPAGALRQSEGGGRRADRSDEDSSSGRDDRDERSGRDDDRERVDTRESDDRIEREERVRTDDRIERIEEVERIERPETVERIERIEKVERVEKLERVEKVEKVERVERVERPEKD